MILDISKFQGNMNFKTAASKGVEAVMCRCAYGAAKDTKFDANAKNAASAKVPIGAYMFATWHYSSVSNSFDKAKQHAEEQTRKALSFLSGKKISAPVAIDLELEKGAELKLSKSQLTEIANYALGIIKDAGYQPLLYCSISWLYDRLERTKIKYPLWLAYYTEKFDGYNFPDTKYGKLLEENKEKMILWQYSSIGDGKYYGAQSSFIDLDLGFDFEEYIKDKDSVTEKPSESTPTNKESVYTVKIKSGTWYIRKSNTTSSEALKTIKGGVTLQASKKQNGWYYIVAEKGWIGPAAIESAAYNAKYVYYTVKSGDNLTKIAKEYKVTVDEIVENNISKYKSMTRDYIQTGWKLKIPVR